MHLDQPAEFAAMSAMRQIVQEPVQRFACCRGQHAFDDPAALVHAIEFRREIREIGHTALDPGEVTEPSEGRGARGGGRSEIQW